MVGMVYGNNIIIYNDEVGNDVWDVDNVEYIFVCYWIYIVFEFFKEKKECEVRFKDDLLLILLLLLDLDDWMKYGFKMIVNMYMICVY